MSDLTSKSYWDERAKGGPRLDTVLVDTRARAHENLARQILSPYRNGSCLDVACGYGRMSDSFKDYTGVDFSPGMVSQGTPGLIVADVHTDLSWARPEGYDVVFALIALSSLKMTAQEFNEKFKHLAKRAVIVFELDTITIFPQI